ncbi:MAG: EamA family transporter [Alphaproteobacteria bacterium]
MELGLIFAVLGAAMLHAGWNAVAKSRLDRRYSISIVALSSGFVVLPLLPFVAVPAAQAWPWLLASVALHVGYTLLLTRAYRIGDFSTVYPLARGTAPIFVVVAGSLWLGETPPALGLAGIALLLAGVLLFSQMPGGATLARGRGGLGYALATAMFIAAYTLVDGVGVRKSGTALGYLVWLTFLEAILIGPIVAWRKNQRHRLTAQIRRDWAWCLMAGIFVVGAYGIVLWAMIAAPIALVAALRETSILFAWLLGVFFLGEKPRRLGGVATLAIIAGVIMVRLYA